MSSRFGLLLRHLRGAARLSQEQLAEQAGLSVRAVSDLERGINRRPRHATAMLLAEAMQLDASARASFLAVASGTEFAQIQDLGTAARPGPTPVPVTSLIGRAPETAAVAELLARDDVRLVSLLGPGGVGKTRLAIEVARCAEPLFPGGAAYVALGAIRDPTLVLPEVARGLGVREGAAPLVTRLSESLAGRRVLLILDNFEQVAKAAPAVGEVLIACPGVTILVTSRTPLRLSAERRFPVPPLGMPGPDAAPTIDALMADSPAVRMFAERARGVDPDWMPDDPRALVELCRRLDGLPLAIELAAARCAVLPVTEMLTYRTLALADAGAADAEPRHRSLRATLNWSHGLLDPAARRLLRALSVFAGGATLEAIEAVSAVDHHRVLDSLTALVEASLVRFVPGTGQARYEMLDTVRQYAYGRLVGGRELPGIRERQVGYFRDLAERAEAELNGPGQGRWLRLIEADLDNLRACLDGSAGGTDLSGSVRIAAALWRFWQIRGYAHEGRDRLERLLGAEGDLPPSLRAKALNAAGILARDQNDLPAAERWLRGSESAAREAGEARNVARAQNNLGNLACDRGDYEAALALYEQSLPVCRQLPTDLLLPTVLINMGVSLGCLERRRPAVRALVEGLRLGIIAQDASLVASGLSNLARVVSQGGHRGYGRRFEERALRLRSELGDTRGLIYSVELLAWLAAAEARVEQAARLIGAAQALRDRLQEPPKPMHRELNRETMQIARTRLGDRRLAKVLASGRELPLEQAVALAGLHAIPGPMPRDADSSA